MKKGKKLYEGKAKILYAAPEKGTAVQHFKDDATAFNNQKKSIIEGKGILNNRISEHILSSLNQVGIETHLIKRINMREQLVKLVEIIPIEFIVRNVSTGSLTKRLGIEDGTVLKEPLIEYCLKDDKLGDPLIAEEHIYAFEWATKKEIDKIFDLDDELYIGLMNFSKKVATAMKKALDCKRVGVSVVGFEVPHAHVHLIPINKIEDMYFNNKVKLTNKEFINVANQIKSYL